MVDNLNDRRLSTNPDFAFTIEVKGSKVHGQIYWQFVLVDAPDDISLARIAIAMIGSTIQADEL